MCAHRIIKNLIWWVGKMKKVLLILFMLLLCVGYFYAVRTNNPRKKYADRERQKIELGIAETKNKLAQEYPKTAEGVIEYHNTIMSYQYSQYMKEEYVKPAIEAVRMLYSQELLDLNSIEAQESALLSEVQSNKEQKVFILQNKTVSTRYNADDTSAIVRVIHYTNIKDMAREYELIKEDGNWKINGWSSVEEEQ